MYLSLCRMCANDTPSILKVSLLVCFKYSCAPFEDSRVTQSMYFSVLTHLPRSRRGPSSLRRFQESLQTSHIPVVKPTAIKRFFSGLHSTKDSPSGTVVINLSAYDTLKSGGLSIISSRPTEERLDKDSLAHVAICTHRNCNKKYS